MRLKLFCLLAASLPSSVLSEDCADYPKYCEAAAMIAGEPLIDGGLGMRVMTHMAQLEGAMNDTQLNYMIQQSRAKSAAVNRRVDAAINRVNLILEEANTTDRLGQIAGFLKTIATLASVANEIQKITAETTPVADEPAERGANNEADAIDGAETYFGQLNEEFALSDEARARVETLLNEDYGGRYFAVKAILQRLETLGPPSGSALSNAPSEQEILLSKAYAILSGWSATEADQTFQDFSFELNSIDDLLDDASKVSPLAVFGEIVFKAQPVGDGTVFSVNNVPGLFEELEPHAMNVLKWRDPKMFEGDDIQPPWRRD